ncbi:MAG: GGDEF domain-containing protein [Chitinophagaceae bacterium]|nr:GGDEF domain-containing protein [Oligoflexus sp.]
MFGKKAKELDANETPEADPRLSSWQNFNRRVSDFLIQSKADLRTLPNIDIKSLLEIATSTRNIADLRDVLDTLTTRFEAARTQETLHLNQYISGLRSMLWTSLNQASAQLGLQNRETEQFEQLRMHMVQALDSDDLLQLKVAVKDWIVMQSQLSQDRKRQQDETQAHFKQQLSRLQNELYQTQTELKLDGLTQVYNRKAFDQEILKTLQIAQLSGRNATLLILDIDHFKHVNDTYGHPVGDKVLQQFAKLIVQNFPSRTDFVARYGGEEFIVLMSDCDISEATAKAQKFITLLRKTTMMFGGVTLRITVSIGAAESRPYEKADDWVKRADVLLYRAKDQGRDCCITDLSAA